MNILRMNWWVVFLLLQGCHLPTTSGTPMDWKGALQQSAHWYGTEEAGAIADRVVLAQFPSGGWSKFLDPVQETDSARIRKYLATARGNDGPTIDNGATTSHLRFLARVASVSASPDQLRAAFRRGLEYLLAAQYPNGGWPQFYPLIGGYQNHITFNDDAMADVLHLLREVGEANALYAFCPAELRERCRSALERGITCILRCQVVINGRKTVWCAQHDEVTFAPAPARAYELVSLSGQESAELVAVLMKVKAPSQEIIAAVEAAVAWFEQTKITGYRYAQIEAPDLPGQKDRVLIPDPQAGPLWARFYDIATEKPVFSDRQGHVLWDVREVSHERRIRYMWYTEAPAKLLAKKYPAWKQRWHETILQGHHSPSLPSDSGDRSARSRVTGLFACASGFPHRCFSSPTGGG